MGKETHTHTHTHTHTETCVHTWWVPVLRTPHGSSSLITSLSWFCVSYSMSMFPWSWTNTTTTTSTARQPDTLGWRHGSTVYRHRDYHESVIIRCGSPVQQLWCGQIALTLPQSHSGLKFVKYTHENTHTLTCSRGRGNAARAKWGPAWWWRWGSWRWTRYQS